MQENERSGATDLRGRRVVAAVKRSGRAKTSVQFATSFCVRAIFWTMLLATLLFFAAIAVTRFWLVPNADDFRPRIVEALSQLTKQRVAIGGLNATWNGWSPELHVSRLQILDSRGRAMLELPEVETTLSWRSLFVFEPRLSSLTIKNPRVVVRRTSENLLTLAGIDVDLSDTTPADPVALEWLLRQRFVQIVHGEFEWHDDWRKLPPLRLRDVNFRLINDGAHHRIGMGATPGAEFASPIHFRAEFVGSDLRKVNDWDGSAYVRVDYANVALLAKYLPLPIEIIRGDGGIQAWFDFEDGRPTAVTTDLVVRDAQMRVPKVFVAKNEAASAQEASAASKALATEAMSSKEPIAVNALSGRLSWRETVVPTGATFAGFGKASENSPTQQRWSLRDVALTTNKGDALPPITAEIKLDRRGEAVLGGEFRANRIELAAAHQIADLFAPVIPNPWLIHLHESAPRGQIGDVVASWSYRDGSDLRFALDSKLRAVEWKRGVLPGVTGLSGKLRASDRDGSFAFDRESLSTPTVVATASGKQERPKQSKVDAKSSVFAPLTLDFGELFIEPLKLGDVSGTFEWKQLSAATQGSGSVIAKRSVWQVRTDGATFENEDAKAKVAGSWQSDELGPGIAKLAGKIERASAAAVHKYLPTTLGEGARKWVKAGILEGKAVDANFAIEGPLWHFPFVDQKLGKFELVAPVTGVTVDYADGWPRAENVDGQLTFRGDSLSAAVNRATIAGATIGATQLRIAEMGASDTRVEIRGTASSTLDNFLRFVETSPVNLLLDRFTEGAKGSGSAKLNLSLEIPVARVDKTKIDGELVFEGNRVELGGDIPALDQLTGRLKFSERDLSAKELRANAFAGATNISVTTEQGVVKASANGRAEILRVRASYDYPLLDQLKGNLDWRMDVQAPITQTAREAGVSPTVRIAGVLSPQSLPFDNVYQAASTPRDLTQPIAFTLERVALPQGRDRIEFDVPSQIHAIIERSAEKVREPRIVERAVVDFGALKTGLPARGYSLRGDVAKLDTDAALALVPALTGRNAKNVGGVKAETSAPDFINVNLKVDRATIFSHVLNDVSIRAQPSGQRWRLALRSKEATGAIAVDSEASSGGIDAVVVRLQRFAWPTPATSADRLGVAGSANLTASQSSLEAETRWPRLDLIAESFVSEGRELGRLEIKAQPRSDEWQIETVKLASADGTLAANGRWKLAPKAATAKTSTEADGVTASNGQTSVEVALNWKDAGRFMQRFGLPKGVERGEGELKGDINWPGSPAQFDYAKLGGKFALKTSAGRFTEMEPGIAKLLGVISLQSLPRRLSFNFDDLFGRGFAFDSIEAEVSIAKGKANTDGFTITGPAARVEIRGVADLDVETAALRVRVFPSLSVATAIGIGLATANPAIGAAAWLGQKIARDPVERILMQEFEVAGPWAKPEVKQTRGVGATTGSRDDPFSDTSSEALPRNNAKAQ